MSVDKTENTAITDVLLSLNLDSATAINTYTVVLKSGDTTLATVKVSALSYVNIVLKCFQKNNMPEIRMVNAMLQRQYTTTTTQLWHTATNFYDE